MIATIGIEKLSVMTLIGVYEYEQLKEQELLIDLRAECDIANCVKSDSVTDALNYALLADKCREFSENNSFKLIETFASGLIEMLWAEFPISKLWIKVSKNALIKASCAYVEMEKKL